MTELTKSQVDRLGDRLRAGEVTEEDLGLLDAYGRSFDQPYSSVSGTLHRAIGVSITGRPAKSQTSIIEKLHRESIRLSQMQDIAGCRLVVPGIAAQNQLVERITGLFAQVHVDDRRQRPSHGYRAVHVIVEQANRHVEIQVRTVIQHGWAELSERMADVIDRNLKYGTGRDQHAIQALAISSDLVSLLESQEALIEAQELEISKLRGTIDDQSSSQPKLVAQLHELEETQSEARRILFTTRASLSERFREAIASLDQAKRG